MGQKLTREQIVAALDAGHLEMIRPQGDWVRVRRRRNIVSSRERRAGYLSVWMEGAVEAVISRADERDGFPGIRVAA